MKTDEEYGIIIVPPEYIEAYKTHKEDGTLVHDGESRLYMFDGGVQVPLTQILCNLHGKKCKMVKFGEASSRVRVFSGDTGNAMEMNLPTALLWDMGGVACQIDTSLDAMKSLASRVGDKGIHHITVTDNSAPKPERFVIGEEYLRLGCLALEVADMNVDNFLVDCTVVTANPVLGLDVTFMVIRLPFKLLKFNNRQEF